MLKCFFAYDKTNYSRHFTYYWASQQNLQSSHPGIYEEFLNGHFAVKRTPGKFNMLPSERVIEQTINKEQKGAGGIIGISTSSGAVQRWIFSSHTIAEILANFKHSLGMNQLVSKPKDLSKSRIILDETAVQICYNVIKCWGNPFEKSETLIGLSSQVEAPENALKDLLEAGEIGKARARDFIHERIETNNVDFYVPTKKIKLQTFEAVLAAKKIKTKYEEVAMRSDRETFARLLVIQKSRGISLENVLMYELSPTPLSLSNPASLTSLQKTAKSELFKHI